MRRPQAQHDITGTCVQTLPLKTFLLLPIQEMPLSSGRAQGVQQGQEEPVLDRQTGESRDPMDAGHAVPGLYPWSSINGANNVFCLLTGCLQNALLLSSFPSLIISKQGGGKVGWQNGHGSMICLCRASLAAGAVGWDSQASWGTGGCGHHGPSQQGQLLKVAALGPLAPAFCLCVAHPFPLLREPSTPQKVLGTLNFQPRAFAWSRLLIIILQAFLLYCLQLTLFCCCFILFIFIFISCSVLKWCKRNIYSHK